MQIIIDIAEEYYNDICNSQTASNYSVLEALDSIRNGTPAKEIYNKGFANGQKALAEHLKLCKEELLDKIRTEIDEQYDRVHPYNISCAEGLEMALEIIDRYKVESEVQEEL